MQSSPTYEKARDLSENMLRLPRELRDQIYTTSLRIASPLPVEASPDEHIPQLLRDHPRLHAEALEAFYAINTFSITLPMDMEPNANLAETWGPYPQAKQHIRHLLVFAAEHYSTVADVEEYESAEATSYHRARWAQFLELPHLTSLAIYMQKAHDASFFTLDFGPIVYYLRTQRPDMTLAFKISFDALLYAEWNHPWWQQFETSPINPNPHPHRHSTLPIGFAGPYSIDARFANVVSPDTHVYQGMGYIDVSDLVMPPSAEDVAYVDEYLSDRKMPDAPSALSGLLDETPAHRRSLGRHYLVKEVALLRVLMQEHYAVYERRLQATDEEKK